MANNRLYLSGKDIEGKDIEVLLAKGWSTGWQAPIGIEQRLDEFFKAVEDGVAPYGCHPTNLVLKTEA